MRRLSFLSLALTLPALALAQAPKHVGYQGRLLRADGSPESGVAQVAFSLFEAALFDAIVVTAAPPRIPEPLKQQLAPGDRLILPVGEDYQELVVVTRTPDGFQTRRVVPVRFVPMTREVQEQR